MELNLWQFQLYIIFNMPIEICGTTREFENRREQQQQQQQQVGHKQVLSVFFMTSLRCAFCPPLFCDPGARVTDGLEGPVPSAGLRVRVKYAEQPSQMSGGAAIIVSVRQLFGGGGGCCSWHLLAFLSRAFLKCLPFRPRNPCRHPSTPPRQVSLTF